MNTTLTNDPDESSEPCPTRPLKQKHPSEPWECYERFNPHAWVIGSDRYAIAHIEYSGSPSQDEETARRIVACVNACAGLSEADLLNAGLTRRIQDLATENARLREALIAAEGYMTRQRAKSCAPFDPEALKQARAALAGEGKP